MAALAAAGADVPEPPEIPEQAQAAYAAFCALRSDRPWIAGVERAVPLPIPFSAIDRYARRMGVEGEAFDMLHRLIAIMDDAWLTTFERTHGK